jgi:hypothetical protein
MAKASKLPPAEEVTAHILKLPPEIATAVQAIRETILAADKDVAEHIKWNNPSFWYSGPMPPSDPKEYKRDIEKQMISDEGMNMLDEWMDKGDLMFDNDWDINSIKSTGFTQTTKTNKPIAGNFLSLD